MNIQIVFPITGGQSITQELAVEVLTAGLTKLIDDNYIKGPIDEVLLDFHQNESGFPVAEIDSTKVIDLGSLQKTMENVYVAPSIESGTANEILTEARQFSQATITERLRVAKRNPKIRLRYMVMDYKNYWKSKRASLKKDPEQVKNLKNMFLQDMNGIMLEVLPFIGEGKQLSQLIGISQVTQGMNTIARDLSLIYRRAIKANDTQGQIPKTIFSKLKENYNKFMNQLIRQVFTGIDEMLPKEGKDKTEPKEKGKTKMHSYTEGGRIKLFS
jgi:hypothetical protein